MTVDRQAAKISFLRAAGWEGANRAPLAGDASNRSYERLTGGPNGARAVLMDASPDKGEATGPFIAIATHLNELGFSAPHILHANQTTGFLLLEDLGDDLFARVAKAHPGQELALYEAAIDFLNDLHRYPAPDFCTQPTPGDMVDLAGLAYEWYAPDTSQASKRQALGELSVALEAHQPFAPVLVLRDFHAENLIWLPERSGTKRIGLLDFQDAIAGHPAYDLISLVEDARRDLPEPLAERLISRYISRSGFEGTGFRAAAAACAAQRNLRILGVFARLAAHFHKPGYIDLIPRVWGHLMRDLSHPHLAGLRERLLADLPPPDSAHLSYLKARH